MHLFARCGCRFFAASSGNGNSYDSFDYSTSAAINEMAGPQKDDAAVRVRVTTFYARVLVLYARHINFWNPDALRFHHRFDCRPESQPLRCTIVCYG